jgi:flagellar biosynthesis protein FliR
MPFVTGFDAAAVIAMGLVARLAVAVVAATLPAFPGVSAGVRMALAVALAVAAWPAAVAAWPPTAVLDAWPVVVAGEAVVGLALGTAVAAVVAAAGWAGSLLGSVSGLSWADDFAESGGGPAAGVDRLAWWVGLAAFCAAGGQVAVVGGLVDSVRGLPVGSVFAAAPGVAWPPAGAVEIALTAVSSAVSLAVALAMPVLAAVVAFHLASAICLRAVPFAPAAGFLQGLAALVLLAAFAMGLDVWSASSAALMHAAIERLFG